MPNKKQGDDARESKVRTLYLTPKGRSVPPLTDAEITALRDLLVKAEQIAEGCPVARRVFSKR